MDAKPGDFFVGLLDFFSVILPGMITVYVCGTVVLPYAAAVVPLPAEEGARALAFFVISYVAGHFIFLAGSALDVWVDRGRKPSLATRDYVLELKWVRLDPKFQVTPKALKFLTGRRSPEPMRGLESKDALTSMMHLAALPRAEFVTEMRSRGVTLSEMAALAACEVLVVNAFQWAKAVANIRSAAAAAEIQRFEAASKFFRSLLASMPLLALAVLWRIAASGWPAGQVVQASLLALAFFGILAAAALARYRDQRQKSIDAAYYHLIALEKLPPAG